MWPRSRRCSLPARPPLPADPVRGQERDLRRRRLPLPQRRAVDGLLPRLRAGEGPGRHLPPRHGPAHGAAHGRDRRTPTRRTGPTCRAAGTCARTRCARRSSSSAAWASPSTSCWWGTPTATWRGGTASSRPASCSTWCRPRTDRPPLPSRRRSPSFFQDDGLLLRKFVYRVAPHEGLKKIEPVVKRIAAPAARGNRDADLRLLRPPAPAHPRLAPRPARAVLSGAGRPRDPGARGRPAGARGGRPHPPLARRHLVGAGAEPRRRRPHRRRDLHAPRGRARADGSGPRHDRPRPARQSTPAPRARRPAPRPRDRDRRRDPRGQDPRPEPRLRRARPRARRRRSGSSPGRPPSGPPCPRRTSSGPRRTSPSTRPCAAGCSSPACSVVLYGKDAGRRELTTGASLRVGGYGFLVREIARGGRKDARLVLYYDRVRSFLGLKTHPARPLPARLPLPAQPTEGRQLTPVPGSILAAGLDARELRLEVRFLQRDPALVTRGALREGAARRGGSRGGVPGRARSPPARRADRGGHPAHPRGAGGPAGLDPRSHPRLRARGDGGNRARRRGQRGAAPPARALRPRELGGEAPRRAAARARAHPGARAGRGQPEERAGRALLRPQPQPERPRDAPREPRPDRGRGPRPRDRPPGARGPDPGAGPHRARRPGSGLALHGVRDRVPVPARGRAARDRPHGEARGAARAGEEPLGSRGHPLDVAARRVDLRDHRARADGQRLPGRGPPRGPRGLAPGQASPFYVVQGETARGALDTAREFVRRHG